MPRKYRSKKKKEPEILYAQCPIRGHVHKLELVIDPERPDLLVAYCEGRAVVRQANPEIHLVMDDEDSPPPVTSYRVPSNLDDEGV